MDKNKILITTSIMLSLLGTGYASLVPARPVMAQTMEMAAKSADKIYETKDWKKIEAKWDEMNKVKVSNYGEISKIVEEQQKDMTGLCEPLIKEGYLSSVSAVAIVLAYGENLGRTLDGKVELPCCYAPPPYNEWDCTSLDTGGELKKKLNLLEEAHKKGTITKEVYTSVKKDINNRLDLLEHADEYWQAKGEGKCDAHQQEVDIILHLYDQDVGGIKEGKDVDKELFKASEYIVKLEHRN